MNGSDFAHEAWVLLEVRIGAIAHGQVPPERGLAELINEIFRNPQLIVRRGSPMGASHDAERLVALQDEYEDLMRFERRTGSRGYKVEQIDALVVSEARLWMARNVTGRL